jgi:hypothetical protein
MTKLKAFVWLDFMTVKSYLTGRNALIYAAVMLFIVVPAGSISSAIGLGMTFATLFVSYPFALGEKSNMDALYATLSLDRKTVVLGRYIFALALNLCAVLFSIALSSVGLLAAKILGLSISSGSASWYYTALTAAFAVIQAMLLPVYFRFGYTKARFLILLPLCLIMAISAALKSAISSGKIFSMISDFTVASGNIKMVIIAGLALCLLAFASYNLSLAFYKKREF